MAEEVKRARKLAKDLATKPGKVIIKALGGKKGAMEFDPKALPKNVQDRLPEIAISHMLGDAAAGRSGVDAEEAITVKWDGLMKGDFSVRAPAAPKVSLTEIAANFSKLSAAEQKTARVLLEGLGITLPA